MKGKLVFALVLAALLVSVVPGISAASDEELKIGSNKVGSTWYVQAAVIADVVRKAYPELKIDASPIAGGIGNIKLMGQGKMNIAMTMGNNIKWAYEGTSLFSDGPVKNIRALIGGLDQFYVGIAARSGSGIKSVEEIGKNKMKIGLMTVQRGTTGEASADQVLEACGFTYDDVKAWGGSVDHTDFEAIANAIRDGRCDLFIQSLSQGHPTFTELAVTGKIDLLGMEEKSVEYLRDKYGYTLSILPAGSFKGQDKDLLLPGYRTCLTVTDRMDDETAYKITKAVYENKEALVKGHVAFSAFNPEKDACDPVNLGGIPLHPGAIKFYQEIGLLK